MDSGGAWQPSVSGSPEKVLLWPVVAGPMTTTFRQKCPGTILLTFVYIKA